MDEQKAGCRFPVRCPDTEEGAMTRYELLMKKLVTFVAVSMSLFHLYVAYAGPPNAFTLRATHFGFALVLAYLSLPLFSRKGAKAPGPIDWLFVILSVAACAYPIFYQQYFNTRMAYVGPVSTSDQVMAILMIVVVLEAHAEALVEGYEQRLDLVLLRRAVGRFVEPLLQVVQDTLGSADLVRVQRLVELALVRGLGAAGDYSLSTAGD